MNRSSSWKSIDSKLYRNLKTKMLDSYVPDLIPAIFVCLIIETGLIFTSVKKNYWADDILILMLSLFVLAGILSALALYFSRRNKTIIEQLQNNNARYHEAVLLLKLKSTDRKPVAGDPNQTFYIIANLNGRLIKLKCTREVFTGCHQGDTICIVDLLGNEAQNKRTCIAVGNTTVSESVEEELPEPVLQTSVNTGITYSSGYDTTARTYRPISDSEKNYIIRKERKRLLPALLPMIICLILFLFCYNVSYGYIVLDHDPDSSFGFFATAAYFLMRFIGILTFIAFLAGLNFSLEIFPMIHELKKSDLKCQIVTLKDINKTYYRVGRTTRTHYYFTCISEQGTNIILESEKSFHVTSGQTALAVFYQTGMKLYAV